MTQTVQPARDLNLKAFSGEDWDLPQYAWEPHYEGKPYGAIMVGSLSIAAGRPAAGKSSWTRYIAAQMTKGTLPGIWEGTPHNVVTITGEENRKFVVIPSFHASGADMTRIFYPEVEFHTPDGKTEQVALMPEKDMQVLTELCIENDVKLVIVDPLMDFMGGVDLYKSNDIRAKLKPWTKLAEDIDGVVLAITHLNKSGNGDVVAGINGSSAFGEVARSVFGFAKDPNSEDGTRIMSQEKNSVGHEGAAWTYHIVGKEITNSKGDKAEFGIFQPAGDSDRTVGEVLREASFNAGDNAASNDVKSFVLSLLESAGGSMPAKKIEEEVKEAGYTWKTVQNQRSKWGVETAKIDKSWVWRIGFKIPDQEEGHIPRDLGILGSSKVKGIKQDPKVSRSQDPTRREEAGSKPKLALVQDPVIAAVMDSLSPTTPRHFGAIMKDVKSITGNGSTVPDVLDELEKTGKITQPQTGKYLLA